MKIELKNVEFSKGLSEETNAYAATVWVDGKRSFEVKNSGHGGCDMQYQVGDLTLREIDAACAVEYPPLDMSEYDMEDVPADLEAVCGQLLEEYLILRDVRRVMRTSIVFIEDNKQWRIKCRDVGNKLCKPSEKQLASAARNYPNALILNGQPDSLIVERMKALG